MKHSLAAFLVLSLASIAVPAAARQEIPNYLERYQKIVQQGYADSAKEMDYARTKGAVFMPIPTGEGLNLLWDPPKVSADTTLLVVIPGPKSDAWKEFRFWHPLIEKRNMAILIPQWATSSVDILQLSPGTLYATAVQPKFISKGFQKNSGILYAPADRASFACTMAGIDRRSGQGHYFGTVVLDGGEIEIQNPELGLINQSVEKLFDGQRWLLGCSDCDALSKTASWLLFHGANVDVLQKAQEKPEAALRDDPVFSRFMALLPPERVEEPAVVPVSAPVAPAAAALEAPAKKSGGHNFAKKRFVR